MKIKILIFSMAKYLLMERVAAPTPLNRTTIGAWAIIDIIQRIQDLGALFQKTTLLANLCSSSFPLRITISGMGYIGIAYFQEPVSIIKLPRISILYFFPFRYFLHKERC